MPTPQPLRHVSMRVRDSLQTPALPLNRTVRVDYSRLRQRDRSVIRVGATRESDGATRGGSEEAPQQCDYLVLERRAMDLTLSDIPSEESE